MKTFVHYDSSGAIHSLIAVDAPEGVSVALESEPGIFVGEVEGVKLTSGAIDVETVSEIPENYKVALPTSRPLKLVKK